MIIIKTAAGTHLINEDEVKSVSHDKNVASVRLEMKDGRSPVVFQVESMTYTNKKDMEFLDHGLMLGAVISDREYLDKMKASAESFIEELSQQRRNLEYMVVSMYECPDENKEYRKRFVEELKEKRAARPNNIKDELKEYRNLPYYQLHQDCANKGREVEAEFERMTGEIRDLKESIEATKGVAENDYKAYEVVSKRLERVMNRNLWQRIINKSV